MIIHIFNIIFELDLLLYYTYKGDLVLF